jgi:hypothetical protein
MEHAILLTPLFYSCLLSHSPVPLNEQSKIILIVSDILLNYIFNINLLLIVFNDAISVIQARSIYHQMGG